MTTRQHRQHPVLEKAYANTAGPVAYLDETFHAATPGSFYVITAVLVERNQMESIRSELRSLAGGTFWHTTTQLATEAGRKQAHAMLEYLGAGEEICVIAHHAQIADTDTDLEQARCDCLRAIGSRLAAGAAPLAAPIGLMVLEERNPRNRSSIDHKTIKDMRGEGLIHRSMQAVMVSPTYEHLLWLPDVVSSAFRRTLTHDDDSLFSLVSDAVHFVDPTAPRG